MYINIKVQDRKPSIIENVVLNIMDTVLSGINCFIFITILVKIKFKCDKSVKPISKNNKINQTEKLK